MVYTVSLNPSIDKTIYLDEFKYASLNRVKYSRSDVGGKGINVSRALNSFGIENNAVIVFAGNKGDLIKQYCSSGGIAGIFFKADGESRENIKIVDMANAATTEINDIGPAVDEDCLSSIVESILSKITENDYLVLTGSLPKTVPARLYYDWAELAACRGAKVILDADGEPLKYGLQSQLHIVKPNLHELEVYADCKLNTMAEIIACGKELISKGIKKVIVSLGEDGSIFFIGNSVYRVDIIKAEVKSTVGAGDSMLASLIYSDINSFDDDKIIRYAVAAATEAVTRQGTEQPNITQIESFTKKVVYYKL